MPCAVMSTAVPTDPLCSTLSAITGTSAMNGAARNVLRHMASAVTRRPGSRRTYRNPSAIERKNFSARAVAEGAGSTSVNITATTARKLTAFAPSAHAKPRVEPCAVPPIAITMPAIAGPITRPRLYCADESAIAPGRSSRGTRSGSIDWNEGNPSAAATPFPSAISVIVGADGWPTMKSTVSNAARPVWNTLVRMSSRRRG